MDGALLKLGAMLAEGFAAKGLQIAHVKLLLRSGAQFNSLSIPRGDAAPELVRSAHASTSSMELTVNARVAAKPRQLEGAAEECLARWADNLGIGATLRSTSSFSPPRPAPTRRIE
jgi:hypothetical protein